MENISYQVTIGETSRVYPAGTTYLSIAREFQDQYEHQIVLVVQNGSRLEELHRELDRDCTLEFVTTKDRIGHDTYKRSMSFCWLKRYMMWAGMIRWNVCGSIFPSAKAITARSRGVFE